MTPQDIAKRELQTVSPDSALQGGEGPLVSVIVPHKDDEPALRVLLQSLAHQSFPLEEFEVIVVNNAPAPLGIEGPPGLNIWHECEPHGASYAARNKGIEAASGEILAFTDSDCVAHPEWIATGVSAVTSAPRAIVAGQICMFAASTSPGIAEKHQLSFAFDQELNIRLLRGVPTANLFVSRTVMNHVGWFDSQMISGGDAEWSKRALRYGFQWSLQEDLFVYHPARSSLKALLAQRLRYSSAITSQHSVLRRMDWLLTWVSPRQGLLSRLRLRAGLRRRDFPVLVLLHLGLGLFQLAIGMFRLVGGKSDQIKPTSSNLDSLHRSRTVRAASREAAF